MPQRLDGTDPLSVTCFEKLAQATLYLLTMRYDAMTAKTAFADHPAVQEVYELIKADGRAGAFRLALLGDLVGASDVLNADGPVDLSTANVNLMGRVETDAGATLTELLGRVADPVECTLGD